MTQIFSHSPATVATAVSVDASSPVLSAAAASFLEVGGEGGNPLSAAASAAVPDMSLSSRAMAAMKVPALSTARAVICPPYANRGGTLRHKHGAEPGEAGGDPLQMPANAGISSYEAGAVEGQNPPPEGGKSGGDPQDAASNHPPLSAGGIETVEKKRRKSRAAATTPEMAEFLGLWFYDWLTVTIPNGKDGKGHRRRAPEAKPDPAEDRAGFVEAREAEARLHRWAVAMGLHRSRIGAGSDGYRGALHLAASPVDGERLATIRASHPYDMPGLEITGGGGECARLAPAALDLLGPVNAARIDVSFDWSQPGLFDALFEYAQMESVARKRPGPRLRDEGAGRTFYWGETPKKSGKKRERPEVMVRVYEKDFERVACGRLRPDDCDPHLVRIEFSFSPRKGAKAGLARLAAENGPGALLGTSLWVRRMAQHIATLTGATGEDAASLAVSRIERLPVSATCEDRAQACLAGSVNTLCSAAAARIVAECYDGDWLAAEVTPSEIRAGVIDMVSEYLDAVSAPERIATRLGLDAARDIDQEAARNAVDVRAWIDRQDSETDRAIRSLDAAYELASSPRDGWMAEQEMQRGLRECVATLSAHVQRIAMRKAAA